MLTINPQVRVPRCHPGRLRYLLAAIALAVAAVSLPDSTAVGEEGDNQPVRPKEANRVLRHAVFFKFKESSGKEDIQRVIDAFRALPTRIDAIKGFQWGTNNSPEGLDDGYTHCFLLTFADEKGRAAYLPHEAHQAFGKVVGPHVDGVFVVDYWGREQDVEPGKMLRHAVFFKFKEDASSEAIRQIEDAFAALPNKIGTIKGFEWGKNNSPENHDQGFTHCFLVTFDSEAGRAAYLPHAEHQAFVKLLMPVLDKVRVLDFWAHEASKSGDTR